MAHRMTLQLHTSAVGVRTCVCVCMCVHTCVHVLGNIKVMKDLHVHVALLSMMLEYIL